ncbi:MAG: peptidoglycan editing factor PgeF [Acidobacteria bacterium]|nr:peptidoglycan editing factor PgeF [Acidobacteriota bacterium]
MWRRRNRNGVEWLEAATLTRRRWLVHAFTTRSGELNLNYSVADSAATVARNRRALRAALGRTSAWQLVTLRQRHTDVIRVIEETLRTFRREPDGALKLAGDAAITNRVGLLLAVQVADCLPILLADPKRRVVAAVHAGWRGTVKRIAEKTVGRMRSEFGCEPQRMLAAMGPGIHRCCYEVGREVVEAYEGQFPNWEKLFRRAKPSPPDAQWQQRLFSAEPPRPGPEGSGRRPRPAVTAAASEKFFLDLVEANRRQLVAAGLHKANIVVSPLCTACRTDLLFSHRAERGRTGRMMGVIGIRKEGDRGSRA